MNIITVEDLLYGNIRQRFWTCAGPRLSELTDFIDSEFPVCITVTEEYELRGESQDHAEFKVHTMNVCVQLRMLHYHEDAGEYDRPVIVGKIVESDVFQKWLDVEIFFVDNRIGYMIFSNDEYTFLEEYRQPDRWEDEGEGWKNGDGSRY